MIFVMILACIGSGCFDQVCTMSRYLQQAQLLPIEKNGTMLLLVA